MMNLQLRLEVSVEAIDQKNCRRDRMLIHRDQVGVNARQKLLSSYVLGCNCCPVNRMEYGNLLRMLIAFRRYLFEYLEIGSRQTLNRLPTVITRHDLDGHEARVGLKRWRLLGT